MGERKGTNKYYPPDFDPRVHRSLDAYHGTHALRERAKKIGQGVIVIRFEMPYNIWCGGCGRHVAMGVRYNAEKKKVGMYYSTPIYEFNMKCHLCDQRYLIRTDPENFDYVIVSGARRKEQRWDPTENGQIAPEDSDTKRRLATDAMYKLEHGKSDEQRGQESAPRLAALAADIGTRGADDIQLNRLVRAGLRDERKRLAAESANDADLLARHSLTGGSLQLLPESTDDQVGAQLLRMDGVAPADAIRPAATSNNRKRTAVCSASSSTTFGIVGEPDELRRRTGESRRLMGVLVGKRRTGGSRSLTVEADASSLATSPTVADASLSATSPKVADASLSATCPKVADASSSATCPKVSDASSSATCPKVSDASSSATSPTVADASSSATCPKLADASSSARSPTVADPSSSATCPKVADASSSATCPKVADASSSATCPKVADASSSVTSPTVAHPFSSATFPTTAVAADSLSPSLKFGARSNPSSEESRQEAEAKASADGCCLVQYSATPSPTSSTRSED